VKKLGLLRAAVVSHLFDVSYRHLSHDAMPVNVGYDLEQRLHVLSFLRGLVQMTLLY
jgi:hypothetical protein